MARDVEVGGLGHVRLGEAGIMRPRRLGEVVKKTRCFLCEKRRECRIDTMNRYFTAEASGKLIPVCLMNCSRYRVH